MTILEKTLTKKKKRIKQYLKRKISLNDEQIKTFFDILSSFDKENENFSTNLINALDHLAITNDYESYITRISSFPHSNISNTILNALLKTTDEVISRNTE